MNDKKIIEILSRALESAPMPADISVASVHPDDVQKWSDRYLLWYNDIRTIVLASLGKTPTNNVYYQLDRLLQESRNIQAELKPENPQQPESEAKGVIIGPIKKK